MLSEPGAQVKEGVVPLSVPEIRGNEWKYVKECLDSGWVSSVGSYVDRFEREVAAYVGSVFAVATVSGTAALHLALLAAGVEPDDEVVVSTLTFIAPANAIRYSGAWPVFIDAEADYWQMDPQRVADFLGQGCRWSDGTLRNRQTGRRVRAILPVHILGHPCDMRPLVDVASRYGLAVIEDATESLGAKYDGCMVGHLGDIACFSFNGNKIITTGGGGMVVTDDQAWARRARFLSTQAKDDPLEYVHSQIGYNYRLSNVQAAIGCAQMENLDSYVAAKRSIARRYDEALAETPGLTTMPEAPWARSSRWMYTVLVDRARFGMDSRALMRQLEAKGVQSRPLWQPLHLSAAHSGAALDGCPVAERLAFDALSLPSSVGLSETGQERVIAAVAAARSQPAQL